MDLQIIRYGSLLSYSPHGESDIEETSKNTMRQLKNDHYTSNPPILMSEYISNFIKKNLAYLPFAHFFANNPILVPIPKSSLMQPETLWVPQRLSNALIKNGFGKTVIEYLRRVNPLRKSATSSNRPKAVEHYNSLGINVFQKMLSQPEEILLIDDVVTRGATIVGAANKLHDTFPEANIRAFAAMRPISSPENFKDIYDPCEGKIELIGQNTFREP